MSIRLLHLAQTLNTLYQGQLTILSSWDILLEDYMRSSSWIKIPEEDLDEIVVEAREAHRLLLTGIKTAWSCITSQSLLIKESAS